MIKGGEVPQWLDEEKIFGEKGGKRKKAASGEIHVGRKRPVFLTLEGWKRKDRGVIYSSTDNWSLWEKGRERGGTWECAIENSCGKDAARHARHKREEGTSAAFWVLQWKKKRKKGNESKSFRSWQNVEGGTLRWWQNHLCR